MLKKGSKLYSILTGTCPRCNEESMYIYKNPYILTKVFTMHDTCSHCGLRYKIEPSFFFGAMYVSYGVGIAFAFAAFVISFFLLNSSLITAFIAIVVTLVAFMPVIMRLSRNIWINFFISYDSKLGKS
ncbi:DUF983 domain-containing protein [Flavobacterium cyanobacteriorum]|uniref:DUF983 domain-containing protein n=1 Tax=Flavobacterium cyanobacteriorum TaxID=2022802 RepID=A0A255Z8D7_9FLAO|nr:DUF983 domain-containing protein [Flavobacterium cyanobacteriorum]OYQ36890.1 DUF983 domain-containing protein [Flavobacterium cyanobacteriorum]